VIVLEESDRVHPSALPLIVGTQPRYGAKDWVSSRSGACLAWSLVIET
jgi:hypothetical protein